MEVFFYFCVAVFKLKDNFFCPSAFQFPDLSVDSFTEFRAGFFPLFRHKRRKICKGNSNWALLYNKRLIRLNTIAETLFIGFNR